MIFDTLRSVLRFRRFEFSATKRRLQRAASIEDLRRIARRRLPGGGVDYIDGGAEDEVAMDRNTRGFRELEFVPRVLRDMGNVDTTGTILGREVPFPLILAPTGFTRIAHPPGELAVARAAERAGLPYSLSTMGTRSVEEVAAVSNGSKWFQVYVWRDKGLLKDMILRAAEAGFEVLCITVDGAMLGRRERDVRRGFTLPPKMGLDILVEGMIRPSWSLRFRVLRADRVRQRRWQYRHRRFDRGRPGRLHERAVRSHVVVGRRGVDALAVGRAGSDQGRPECGRCSDRQRPGP